MVRNLRIAAGLVLALAWGGQAQAADAQLSGLSAASAVSGTDLVPTSQGGNLLKQTLSAVATYIGSVFSSSGDCTATGAIVVTCTKTSGVAFAASATTNALNASNISSGTLGVARGGTGQGSYTDGQLLIGNTSTGLLSKATLTQGSGVTITNGNGTITIAASGGGGGCTVSGTAGQIVLNDGASGCSSSTATISTGALSLGASGTLGSVTMGNATSGTLLLRPVTGALGTVTVSIPAATTTLAALSVNQSWTAGQAVTPDTASACGTQSAAGTMTPNYATTNSCVATFGAGNLTIANPSGPKAGQSFTFVLTQDSSGSRTVTWGSQYKWSGGSPPTLSTAANAKDVISCFSDTTSTHNCALAVQNAL